jgi:phosphatidylglycerophosphate synthase
MAFKTPKARSNKMANWDSILTVIAVVVGLWPLVFGSTQNVSLLIGLIVVVIFFVIYNVYKTIIERLDALDEKAKSISEQMKYHDLDKRIAVLENLQVKKR